MAPNIPQRAGATLTATSGTTSTLAPAFASNVGAGGALLALIAACEVSTGNPTITSVTSNGAAEKWAPVTSVPANGNTQDVAYAWLCPYTAGGFTVTDINVTWGSAASATASNLIQADVYEITGLTNAVADVVATTQGSTGVTSWTVGPSAATTTGFEVWFGMASLDIAGGATATIAGPGSPWTNSATIAGTHTSGGTVTNHYLAAGHQALPPPGTIAYAGTSSASVAEYAGIVIALKGAPVGSSRLTSQAVKRAAYY